MSDHTTHSSTKSDNTPDQSTLQPGGAGGAGFDEELISKGVNIQRALSHSGDTPPDPKTVLSMQSTLGNRTTIQLVSKNHPKAKLQRKSKKDLPFSGLRMIQRNPTGGGEAKAVDEEEELDLGDEDLENLEDMKETGVDEENIEQIDFSDEPMDIKGNPNGPDPQDEEEELDLGEEEDPQQEVADMKEDPQAPPDPQDEEEELDLGDGPNDAKADPEPDGGQMDVPEEDNEPVVEPEDVPASVKDVDLDNVGNDAKQEAPAPDPEPQAPAAGGEKKGKSTGAHVWEGTKAVGKGFLNATVGLGLFSAVDFWKGVLEVDKKKQKAMYGDNWKAWTFLENTVNLAQAVADITTSIGFITGIAGAITSVLAPPAAPFLVTMSTIAGTFATIAHIIAGVGRIVLGIKLATRLSELEPGSKEHSLVKGTMIRQFVGAVANTIGAVTGGIGGALNPTKTAGEAVKGLAGASGSAWKEGGKALLTGVTNQGIGGSSGDLGNAIASETTEDMVERKVLQRKLNDMGIVQREGASNEETIKALDERIALIRKLKGNLSGGMGDIKESEALGDEKKEMRKQQLAGIQQGLPELQKLDSANKDAKAQGEQAEEASKKMESTIADQKPPEEKKDKSLWGKIKSAAKAAFRKLLSVFNALKKKVLGFIAKLKAKLVGFVMNLLGVAEPAKEVENTMLDKQKELPEAIAQEEKNKEDGKQVQSEIKEGLPQLEKAEKQALDIKQQLLAQDEKE